MGQAYLRGTIAGAATLIAVLTVASRVFGFARNVVFTVAVGPTELGDIYLAANTIPNIVFEIVAGGALASLVVPLLAGPVAAGDRRTVGEVTSGLLTWTLMLLLPLSALLALAAGPVIDLLAPGAGAAQREAGVLMLRIFAPQLPLYGVGIVLTGLLQAHRRFAWPVIAPLLSSVTMISIYLGFAAITGPRPALESVQRGQIVLLAAGTTMGVAVLSLCLLIPVARLGTGVRPTLQLPTAARGLALAGAAAVVAQQLALLIVIRLALAGPEGSNVVYNLAQTFYLLPWAVLAVPAATAAYPSIVTAPEKSGLVARAGSAILLLSCLGATGLVVLARPISGLVLEHPRSLELAIIGFAPGLVGYGLAALHQRTLYAVGAQRFAALAIGLGWAVAVGAAFALSATLDERPLALALANSIGMTVLGVALAVGVARRCGRASLRGGVKALTVGLAAGAGAVFAAFAATPRDWPLIWQGMLAGSVALLVFAAVWKVVYLR